MIIQHRQYLALLDELQYLKNDNSLLRQQNIILSEELIKQKQKRLQLEKHHQSNMKLIEELHSKSINSQSDNTKQIMQKMNQYNSTTKTFIEDKFKILENATCNQTKQTQLKQTKNKIDLYELNDFANKIRNIFKETQNSDNSQNKKLSFNDMAKWIKGIAMANLTQQKMGLTASMSTTSMKKQSKQVPKMKQNKSLLNVLQSKTKILPTDGQKPKNQA